MDFNVRLNSGHVLNGYIQTPAGEPDGIILLVHGIGEHAGRYLSWADLFRHEKFSFAALDLPGHGKSDGGRGKIKKYSQLYEMIDILIETISKTFPGVPVYLYGHSLGGGIVLDYTVRFHPDVKGVIATSPWLRLSFEPPKTRIILAEAVKNILPGFVQATGLVTDYLSHNREVVDSYNNDPLVHDKISAAFFAGANASAKYALAHASDLKVPALLVHGSDDLICSPEGSREFASKTPLAALRIWDKGYHELHNEPFREEVFRYIMNWIRMPEKWSLEPA